jgi:hypothetical protein
MQQSSRPFWCILVAVLALNASSCTDNDDTSLGKSLLGPALAKPPLFQLQGDNSLASDDFNRTDQNPLVGNWTSPEPPEGMAIGYNRVVPSSIDADDWAYYSGMTWPDDQYSKAKLYVTGSAGGDRGMGLLVRRSASAITHYRVVVDHASTGNVGLSKTIAGAYTLLATFTQNWTDGDVWELRVRDTTLQIFWNDNQVGTDVTDGSISSGYPGIAYSFHETSAALDDWDGGSVGAGDITWPNEPAGFSLITEYDFSEDIPIGGNSLPMSDGWFINNWSGAGGSGAYRASDANAPLSPSSVGRWKYGIDFAESSAPATMYHPISGRELYVGIVWKASKPFQQHSAALTKIIFTFTGTEPNPTIGNLTYMRMNGVEEPFSIVLGDAPLGANPNMYPNVTQSDIWLDAWYRIEWYQKMSTTATSADGIIRVWVSKWNGSSWDAPVLNIERTDLNFVQRADPSLPAVDFAEFQFSPTWGGNAPGEELKTQEDSFWFDHVHLSVAP